MPERDTPPPARSPIQLAICIPCRDEVDYEFSRCLSYLCLHLGATAIAAQAVDVNIFHLNGSVIDSSRSRLTHDALVWGATHLLWLDSDMTFPPDTFHRLFKHNVDIVGVNYPTRRHPHRPTANLKMPVKAEGKEGVKLYTGPDSTGMVEVEGMGFGCVLLKRSAFEAVPAPGFLSTYDPVNRIWRGEDIYFCQEAIKHGLKVYVDQDLSKEIGHAGRMVYTNEHAWALRELNEAPPTIEVPTPRLIIPGEQGA